MTGDGRADPDLVALVCSLGATPEQVAGLGTRDLIGLAGDLALAGGLDLTLEELAARSGTTVARARAVYRSLGLDVDALAGFGEGDVELLSLVVLDQSGLVAAVADELLRVAGTALRRVAEATVAAYVQDVEGAPGPELPGLERAPAASGSDVVAMAELNHVASRLVLDFAGVLDTMFRHHMWSAVRAQRAGQAGVARPELVEAAVGFVDLVGYTSMARTASPGALMSLVDEFERRAFELALEHGGRVVKSIGDEVMVTAPDLERVALVTLALVESFGDERSRPRGGVSAGEVVFRLGDLYGPVVNMAARLVAAADPGVVLTDLDPSGARSAAGIALEAAGTRELKGFEGPVQVWSISRRPPPAR